MPLVSGDLVTISSLQAGKIDDENSIPDWVFPAEVRGNALPINNMPYQHQTIDVFSGLMDAAWSVNFDNPLQRMVCDLEIFFGENAPLNMPPDLTTLQLTVAGFSRAVIFTPAKSLTDTVPANYLGLTVNGVTPVYKFGGKRRYMEQSGLVVIPLRMVLLSTAPLGTSETTRTLSVSLGRLNTTQTATAPIISGMIYTNPLPSSRDVQLAT
ncbi:hypothetical protein [Kosakonia sacchari]|uniref:hypothetical protein n=1 Tax=Kosakonia sacchari TaxID=1158459 RepID=UPI0015856A2C|nr:hypothetical protein [Kosakonia sacchari]NUL35066.1 hypothetical protein [Kosakonia sacchari]